MNKVVHAAQRAAFSAAIDVTINAVRGKGTEKLSENAVKLVIYPVSSAYFFVTSSYGTL